MHSSPSSSPSTPVTSTGGFVSPAGSRANAPQHGEPGVPPGGFVDRRRGAARGPQTERRQFGSSHEGLSEPGRELALAIDEYKLRHHRRYITCDEMLAVIRQLGYHK